MFSGFQSNAFQANAFQIIPGDIAPSAVIGGHFVEMTAYRRQLERMIKSAEKRDEKRYRNQVKQLIDLAKDAGIAQPEVAIVEKSKEKSVDLNFTLIISELNRLLLEIERVAAIQAKAIAEQQEEEERLIFLLALS
jgi:flagellar motor component MotA